MPIEDLINMDVVVKAVKKITASYRDDELSEAMSEKARKISKILSCSRLAGAQHNALHKIAEVLLGEEITAKRICTSGYPLGVVVVPIKKSGSHNYTLNEPVLIDIESGRSGIRSNGILGNTLPRIGDSVRYATDVEIDGYFKSFDMNCGIHHLISFISKVGSVC